MEYAKRIHSVEQIVRAQNPLTTKGGKRDRKESERVRKSKEKEMTIKEAGGCKPGAAQSGPLGA